jgi:hypothetical protein
VDNQQELAQKHEKLKKWATVIALGAIGLFVAPFIFLAIGGLLGLGVAAAVGFTMVQMAPWFALKIANLKYRMIEAENVAHIKKVAAHAAENPIETMSVMLVERRKAFDRFKQNVIEATTARDTFKEKLAQFTKQYPHRANEFQVQLERMADLVERKKTALRAAQQSLEDGQLKLDEMKAYWEMSQVMQAANKAAGMDTGDAFEKLKADTACDAVFESMNRAFAQMEVAASLDVNSNDKPAQPVAQLGVSEPVVIDVQVRETQKVSR